MEERTKNNSMKKVLVALRASEVSMVAEVLGDEFELVVCHSMNDAVIRLDDSIGLIACGVHFDSGRMFDFLRHVKNHPRYNRVPFFILLGVGRYSQPIMHGIRSAAKLMGAAGFTDLSGLREKVGGDQAHEQLRRVVRQVLSPGPPAPADTTDNAGGGANNS
jgi:hypothetical protein